ncbi:TRAP transporter permease [Limnochorda pilosa]|uniref:C4-dicarboxylate ABC transporter n=1 Tax=Limnochorda pilosa TaxID=1555112 RepID=A0A0K2SM77_LIMPI|nr:TRAP transporter permease [Limnochorda pilosa]BAS28205.1 C4-dicarboxylate ABC transporter [Limnochorda pilosa]
MAETAFRTAWRRVVAGMAISLALFQLATALLGNISPLQQRFVHLLGALILTFLIYDGRGRATRLERGMLSNALLALITLALGIYMVAAFSPDAVLQRGIWGLSPAEEWVGLLLLVLVLEAARRAVGWPLVLIAGLFVVYALAGPYFPAFISHKGYSIWRLVETFSWTTEGVLGVPIAASATYVAVFILFGSFLERLGGARFFLDLSLAAAGHQKGGPAQVAIVSSGLMGTISGSAVANVVTTGAFTIPLMKRIGYRPHFAGAVEAVASTGGQIMPPVMGAAAFVMAEMIEAPYWQIVLAAILPAVLYYAAAAIQVYLRADRLGLEGIPRSELPRLGTTLAAGWYLLIPLAVLIHLLMVLRYSPTRAGIWSLLLMVAVSSAQYLWKERRFPWREILEALESGGRTLVVVATACGAAGIIIGVVSLTGIGVRFSQLVIDLAGGMLPLTLLYTMLACIVLGMGLPTTAAYIVTAVLAAPALVELGVPLLAAHLFVLYFAVLSFITPPVAIAAYAAAGLAGANAMQTGWTAMRLGLAGFIVPFMFVYNQALLLAGPWALVLLAVATAAAGVAALAAGVEGWLFGPVPGWQRLLLAGAAILLIVPGWATDLGGLALGLGVYALRRRHLRAASPAAEARSAQPPAQG